MRPNAYRLFAVVAGIALLASTQSSWAAKGHGTKARVKGPSQKCFTGKKARPGGFHARRPQVYAESYNGAEWRPPQRTPNRVVRRRASADPTAFSVLNVDPGTALTIYKQVPNMESTALRGCVGSCDALKGLAKKNLAYEKLYAFTPEVTSRQDIGVKVFAESKKIIDPNTPIKVVGKTRYGQETKPAYLNVEGRADQNLTLLNHERMGPSVATGYRVGGRFLNSADAWAVKDNLYITAPHINKGQIATGRLLLRKAKAVRTLLAEFKRKAKDIDCKLRNNDYAPENVQRKQQELAFLNARISGDRNSPRQAQRAAMDAYANQIEAKANQMIEAGKVKRSMIISLAGMPRGADVNVQNPRQAEEGKAMNAASGKVVGALFTTEIAGIAQDAISMTVSYASNNAKKGSRTEIDAAIPDMRNKDIKPVGSLGKLPVYKLNPERLETFTERADNLNE